MSPLVGRVPRILAALAMISLLPAYLFIEAELVSRTIRPELLQQQQAFSKAIQGTRGRSVSCTKKAPPSATVSEEEVRRLLERALVPTLHVDHPFQSDTLFWSFEKGLPYSGGLYSVYFASGRTQDLLAHLTRRLDLCRRVSGDDEDETSEEEKRSQAWLDEQRQELEKLDRDLATARKAYEEDRPKLAAVAWTLGVLQVLGWGLLYLVVLPQDVRTWRQRRAAKKSGPT